MPRRRHLPALASAVLLLGACSAPSPDAGVVERGPAPTVADGGSAAPPADVPPAGGIDDPLGPADPGAHASLTGWAPCGEGFECATLTVPRRWDDVDGPSLDLAVVRRPATGDRIGSLVLNPGGPGVSGVDFLRGFVDGGLPAGLEARFDVLSWDPRGTGRSGRIDCTTDQEWEEAEVDPTPDDAAELEALRTEAVEDTTACVEQEGELLEVVGTRATARDLDALRGVLGDERLSYVGYSYGTTIGIEYLRLYPGRVRAMVLDGVALPGVDPVDDSLAQAVAFERTLDAYLAGCAERAGCTLGTDPRATLLGLVDRLEEGRLPADYSLQGPDATPRSGTLGVGELYIAVASALYNPQAWPVLDQALAEALGPEPSGRGLLALRDDYLGRQPDGSWSDDADARGAIRCADQEARADQPEGDTSLVAPWSARLPFWGAWFAVGEPGCWGVPPAVEPLGPLGPGAVAGAPPVVVIGTTGDPATPYEQAEEAAEVIEGSVLVTFVGDQHTVYSSQSDCIDEPVTAYLVDGEPPPAGLRCEA